MSRLDDEDEVWPESPPRWTPVRWLVSGFCEGLGISLAIGTVWLVVSVYRALTGG